MATSRNQATKIIQDFRDRGWESKPFERTIDLVLSSSEAATQILLLALRELPKYTTITDFAFSFVSEDDFAKLVEASLAILDDNPNQQMACSVITCTTLQSPATLHPHLTLINELAVNIRFKAWDCLLETRDRELVDYAITVNEKFGFVERLDIFLNSIGFDYRDYALRRICHDRAYHIIFGQDYFDRQKKPDWRRIALENHPTWILDSPDSIQAQFGGI